MSLAAKPKKPRKKMRKSPCEKQKSTGGKKKGYIERLRRRRSVNYVEPCKIG